MAVILFVDDDMATLELMGRAAEMLGHRSLLCSLSQHALAIAISQRPDLILVDHLLQDGQGCQLIETLRQQAGLRATPIYLVSAFASEKEKETARQAGADGCIEKPVSLQNLAQMLSGKGG